MAQSTVNWFNHEVPTKTPLGQHLLTHERPASYNPDAPENRYPRMLYKAEKRDDGKILCMDTEPKAWLYPNMELHRMAVEAVENWNRTHQLTVYNEYEEKQQFENGWRASQKEAIAEVEKWQLEMAKAYAERAFTEQKMSPEARAEAKKHDDATTEHVPVIPESRGEKKLHWKTAKKLAEEAAAKASAA